MQIFITITKTSPPWNLTLDTFADRLVDRRPDARTRVGSQRDLHTGKMVDHLDFDLEFDNGRRDGVYFPALPHQQLVVEDGPADDWAPIIVWFLGLLPESAQAQCFLEANPNPRPISKHATAEDISRIVAELDAADQ